MARIAPTAEMAEPDAAVDVRDMLCAQALAVADRAMRRLASGQLLEVRYNTHDVAHDLRVWAGDRGHAVLEEFEQAGEACLRIRHA
jgi:TusA-related sulfurtransferase